VAALLFSVVFALVYPVFVTIDAQAQTGFRYTYIFSAWSETLSMTDQNVSVSRGPLAPGTVGGRAGAAAGARPPARPVLRSSSPQQRRAHAAPPHAAAARLLQGFWGFCTGYLVNAARHVRTARFPPDHEPWDLHPLNWIVALGTYVLGWVVTSVLLLLIVAIKLLPMLLRAYSNHVYVFKVWSPLPCSKNFKWYMGLGYFLAFAFFPVAGALLFPAMIVYAAYLAALAALDVLLYRGRVTPGLARLSEGVKAVQRETSRYIMRQDVPFLVLPSHNPISLSWLLAGLLPWVFALVLVPPLVAIAAVLALLPSMVRSPRRLLPACRRALRRAPSCALRIPPPDTRTSLSFPRNHPTHSRHCAGRRRHARVGDDASNHVRQGVQRVVVDQGVHGAHPARAAAAHARHCVRRHRARGAARRYEHPRRHQLDAQDQVRVAGLHVRAGPRVQDRVRPEQIRVRPQRRGPGALG